jgi:hypothetical protein
MRDLDDLDPQEFERLANELMLAQYPDFRPYPTTIGRNDGGWDGAQPGVYQGIEATWRLSAKKLVSGEKGPKEKLRDHLRKDFERYPEQSWIVITNADLHPRDQLDLEQAFVGMVVHLKIVAFPTLNLWLEDHPYIAARYDLHNAVWAPGRGLVREVGPGHLPDGWKRAVDDVLSRLQSADSGRIRVLAPDDASAALLLDALYHRLRETGDRTPVALELDSPAEVPRLREAMHKLGPGNRVFLVYPMRDDTPNLVARACALAWTVGVAPSATQVTVPTLEPEAVLAWTANLAPTVPLPTRARWVYAAGGSAGLLYGAWRGTADPETGWYSALQPVDQDLVVLAALREPLFDRDVDDLAAKAGRASLQVRAVLDRTNGLLIHEGKRYQGGAPWRVARFLQQVLSQGFPDRLERELPADPTDALVRLAAFGIDEGPLIRQLQRDRHADPADIVAWAAVIRRSEQAAPLSDTLADEVAAILSLARRHRRSLDVVRLATALGTRPGQVGAAISGLAAEAREGTRVRPDEVIKKWADPFLYDTAHLDGVAAAFAQAASRADDVHLARWVVAWAGYTLASAAEYSASAGYTVHFGSVGLGYPVAKGRREAAGRALESMVRSTKVEVRREGWRGWKRVWADPSFGGGGTIPADVHELLLRGIDLAKSAFQSPDWQERALAERFVLGLLRFDREGDGDVWRAKIASTLLSFSTEAPYLAWRLTCDRVFAVVNPTEDAAAIEKGRGWSQFAGRRFGWPGPEVVRSLAARMAVEVPTVDLALDWLNRAADRPGDGWFDVDVLRGWAEAAPDLFDRLLFSDGWSRVPRDLRPWLIAACRELFGAKMARFGPHVDGHQLGMVALLQTLVDHPERVSADEALSVFGGIRTLVPERQVPALWAVAAHPDDTVRRAVIGATADLLYREAEVSLNDLVSIVRRCLDGHPKVIHSVFSNFDLLNTTRDAEANQLFRAISDDMLNADAEIHGHTRRFYEAAWPEVRGWWLERLKAASEAEHRIPSILIPYEVDPGVRIEMAAAWAETQVQSAFVHRRVLEDLVRDLNDGGFAAAWDLANDEGRRRLLMAYVSEEASKSYLERMVETLGRLPDEDGESALNELVDRYHPEVAEKLRRALENRAQTSD